MSTNNTTDNAGLSPADIRKVEDTSRVALDRSIENVSESVVDRLAVARKAAIEAQKKQLDAKRGDDSNIVSLVNKRSKKMSLNAIWAVAASIFAVSLLWFYQSDESVHTPMEVAEVSGAQDTNEIGQGLSNGAEALLVALEYATLDEESSAIVDDLEFMYWLSLEQNSDA